jgi:hypothetical protein
MHVHLPKQLHGWREFLGEVGIIVVGVGIALIAEQLVEAWHWRQVVAEEGEALDQEVYYIWDAMTSRVALQTCVDRRLADLAIIFARHESRRPVGLTGPIGRPRVSTVGTTALQIATADGALSHMSLTQKRAYLEVYESYDLFTRNVAEERASWRALQSLNHPASLSDTDWSELRKAYDAAVDSNVTLKFNLVIGGDGEWLTPFKKFSRWPSSKGLTQLPSVKELCSPSLSGQTETPPHVS